MKNPETRKLMIVRDRRDNRVFLDYSDSMLRTFEEVLMESNSKIELLKEYPEAIDVRR